LQGTAPERSLVIASGRKKGEGSKKKQEAKHQRKNPKKNQNTKKHPKKKEKSSSKKKLFSPQPAACIREKKKAVRVRLAARKKEKRNEKNWPLDKSDTQNRPGKEGERASLAEHGGEKKNRPPFMLVPWLNRVVEEGEIAVLGKGKSGTEAFSIPIAEESLLVPVPWRGGEGKGEDRSL